MGLLGNGTTQMVNDKKVYMIFQHKMLDYTDIHSTKQ